MSCLYLKSMWCLSARFNFSKCLLLALSADYNWKSAERESRAPPLPPSPQQQLTLQAPSKLYVQPNIGKSSGPFWLILKGTVARDFLPLVFCHESTPDTVVPEFTPWNNFEFFFEFGEIFVFECCSAGFEIPQDFVPQGLIPRRTLWSGVSDPAGSCSARYQTPQNKCLL